MYLPLFLLPIEVLELIFQYSSYADRMVLRQVCKRWNCILDGHLFRKDFNLVLSTYKLKRMQRHLPRNKTFYTIAIVDIYHHQIPIETWIDILRNVVVLEFHHTAPIGLKEFYNILCLAQNATNLKLDYFVQPFSVNYQLSTFQSFSWPVQNITKLTIKFKTASHVDLENLECFVKPMVRLSEVYIKTKTVNKHRPRFFPIFMQHVATLKSLVFNEHYINALDIIKCFIENSEVTKRKALMDTDETTTTTTIKVGLDLTKCGMRIDGMIHNINEFEMNQEWYTFFRAYQNLETFSIWTHICILPASLLYTIFECLPNLKVIKYHNLACCKLFSRAKVQSYQEKGLKTISFFVHLN